MDTLEFGDDTVENASLPLFEDGILYFDKPVQETQYFDEELRGTQYFEEHEPVDGYFADQEQPLKVQVQAGSPLPLENWNEDDSALSPPPSVNSVQAGSPLALDDSNDQANSPLALDNWSEDDSPVCATTAWEQTREGSPEAVASSAWDSGDDDWDVEDAEQEEDDPLGLGQDLAELDAPSPQPAPSVQARHLENAPLPMYTYPVNRTWAFLRRTVANDNVQLLEHILRFYPLHINYTTPKTNRNLAHLAVSSKSNDVIACLFRQAPRLFCAPDNSGRFPMDMAGRNLVSAPIVKAPCFVADTCSPEHAPGPVEAGPRAADPAAKAQTQGASHAAEGEPQGAPRTGAHPHGRPSCVLRPPADPGVWRVDACPRYADARLPGHAHAAPGPDACRVPRPLYAHAPPSARHGPHDADGPAPDAGYLVAPRREEVVPGSDSGRSGSGGGAARIPQVPQYEGQCEDIACAPFSFT